MSAPEARCASAMTAFDGYLPVPTTRRERKVRPAMMSGSEVIYSLRGLVPGCWLLAAGSWSSAAADESHDFDLVALADHRVVVPLTLDDDDVVFDRDDAGIDVERASSALMRDRAGDFERLAVQSYGQSLLQTRSSPPSRCARRLATRHYSAGRRPTQSELAPSTLCVNTRCRR